MCLDGAMVQRSETRRHGVEILAEWAAARTNVLLVLEAEEDAEEWLGQACCLSIMHGRAGQECPGIPLSSYRLVSCKCSE